MGLPTQSDLHGSTSSVTATVQRVIVATNEHVEAWRFRWVAKPN